MTAPVIDRTDALRELGTDVRTCKTATDALTLAGIAGMDVRKVALYDGTGAELHGQFGLRTASGSLLEKVTVGRDFTVVNYEETAAALDEVASQTGAVFDACGALDVDAYGLVGARAFVSMKLPAQGLLGGIDPVDRYLVAFMSHGLNANILGPTATRVWCANQQPQISNNPDFKIVIRHTTSAPARTANARYALEASVKSMDVLRREAEQMLRVTTTEAQFLEMVARIYPARDDAKKAAKTRHERRVEALQSLRAGATNTNIVNTAWGDWQAVTEYSQHYKAVKGGDLRDSGLRTGVDVLRARRSLTDGTEAKLNVAAYQTIRQMVGLSA